MAFFAVFTSIPFLFDPTSFGGIEMLLYAVLTAQIHSVIRYLADSPLEKAVNQIRSLFVAVSDDFPPWSNWSSHRIPENHTPGAVSIGSTFVPLVMAPVGLASASPASTPSARTTSFTAALVTLSPIQVVGRLMLGCLSATACLCRMYGLLFQSLMGAILLIPRSTALFLARVHLSSVLYVSWARRARGAHAPPPSVPGRRSSPKRMPILAPHWRDLLLLSCLLICSLLPTATAMHEDDLAVNLLHDMGYVAPVVAAAAVLVSGGSKRRRSDARQEKRRLRLQAHQSSAPAAFPLDDSSPQRTIFVASVRDEHALDQLLGVLSRRSSIVAHHFSKHVQRLWVTFKFVPDAAAWIGECIHDTWRVERARTLPHELRAVVTGRNVPDDEDSLFPPGDGDFFRDARWFLLANSQEELDEVEPHVDRVGTSTASDPDEAADAPRIVAGDTDDLEDVGRRRWP